MRVLHPRSHAEKVWELTAIERTLDQAGSRRVPVDGKQTSRRQLLAAMVWDYVTLGSATLPNGAPLTIPLKDWFAVVKWLYGQIDGAPNIQAE